MAHYPGQANSDFERGSSALRIIHVGHRTSFGATLTDDGFTQDNPRNVTAAGTESSQLPTTPPRGVLGGSVAFTRPDAGNGMVGGPPTITPSSGAAKPIGLFINDAQGNAYENSPATASGNAPYVSGQGTYGTFLYETQTLDGSATNGGQGDDLIYEVGQRLWASRNGFLTSAENSNGLNSEDTLEGDGSVTGATFTDVTMMGIVRVTPDSSHAELVFDLRI